MAEKLAPIVLFIYNRPDHTRQTLNALADNVLADQSDLIIYADGPKENASTEVIEKIKQTRAVAHEKKWCRTVTVIESEKNKGLADSIIGGVTEVVNKYGRVIVLEDDIVTGKHFLEYMNTALEKYENDERVMSVTGYIVDIKNKNKLPESFFMPWFECWSWATWQRSWKYFKRNPEELVKTYTPDQIKRVNMNGTNNLWQQVLDNYNGKIKTWAIFNVVTICEHNGLVLYSREPLCKNIGFDGSGENCGNGSIEDICNISNKPVTQFPDFIESNNIAEQQYMRFYRKVSKKPSILFRLKNIFIFLKKNGFKKFCKKIQNKIKK